jgi:hypothetical protein
MSDIVIRSDYSDKSSKKGRKRRRDTTRADSHIETNGVLVISADNASNGRVRKSRKVEEKANVMVVSSINMRQTRKAILNDAMSYTPASIVEVFRKYYTDDEKKNVMTMTVQDGDSKRKLKLSYSLSTMLSRFKKQLSKLKKPEFISDKLWERYFRLHLPPCTRKPTTLLNDLWQMYLDGVALSKIEYKFLLKKKNDTRSRNALKVVTIENSDDIVMQALKYATPPSSPQLAMCSLLVLTGLRPSGIAKIAKFSTSLNQKQSHPEFWVAQTRFAKRGCGKNQTKYAQKRDRPFLAPYWMIERLIKIVRAHWPTKHLNTDQIQASHGTTWRRNLRKAYPQLPGITPRLCRKIFASYSFHYFGKACFVDGIPGQASLSRYISYVLGHADYGDTALSYSNLVLRPKPKLKLFEVARSLKIEQPKRR